MKSNFLFFVLFFMVGFAFAQTKDHEIDSFMRAANHAHFFNGTVLVARHDSILLQKGYGYRDVEKKISHDSLSIFQIGSLSKSFTAICIMQQLEQGHLRLSDTLGYYFPFYKNGAQVTIEQLLTHTGGIWEYSQDPDFMASIYTGHFTETAFWKLINDKPLDFSPGTKFHYSNTGYMILGYLLEKVTGRSYWQLVREGIFQKAGMYTSGFDFAGLKSRYRCVGYETIFENPIQPAQIVDSSYSFAAGAIYSTTGDLYRYSKALLEGRLITHASMEKAFKPVLQNYGYGWTIEFPAGKRAVFHGGAIPGFLTLMSMLPDEHSCIILISNNRDQESNLQECYTSLLKILMNDPYVLPRLAVPLPVDNLVEYTGNYELVDNKKFQGHLTLQDGQLMLQWNTDKIEKVFSEKKDLFFITTYDLQLTFTRGQSGSINGFTAHTAGKSFIYQKMN